MVWSSNLPSKNSLCLYSIALWSQFFEPHGAKHSPLGSGVGLPQRGETYTYMIEISTKGRVSTIAVWGAGADPRLENIDIFHDVHTVQRKHGAKHSPPGHQVPPDWPRGGSSCSYSGVPFVPSFIMIKLTKQTNLDIDYHSFWCSFSWFQREILKQTGTSGIICTWTIFHDVKK